MLKGLAKKYCLVWRKDVRMHVLCGALWNYVLYLKWRIHKFVHHIDRPIIHYYSVCWNEEKMLPFMFYHYDKFIDRYYIYDNESTDSSISIINNHPNAKLITFKTDGFNDMTQNQIKNECWKKSRGKADYVVVCDIDEFFYVPDMNEFIKAIKEERVSLPMSNGYDMVSDKFPNYALTPSILDVAGNGVPNKDYAKCIFFNPYKIVEINYDPGAHICHPLGIVRCSTEPQYKVLHYKNLGVEYVLERYNDYKNRMSIENIKNGFAFQYFEEEETIVSNVRNLLSIAQKII